MPPQVRRKARRTEVISSPNGGGRDDDEPLLDDGGETVPTVMVQLVDENGEPCGAQVLMPVNATTKQLDAMLHATRGGDAGDDDDEDSRVPHSFFIGDEQIMTSVRDVMHEAQKKSWLESRIAGGWRVKSGEADQQPFRVPEETVVKIVFKPQAVFRVRAVSRCSATLDGHEDAVLVVAFSPDGRMLATGGGDHIIKMWDVLTSTPLDDLKGHKGWVQVLSWAPDGSHLVSGSRDGGLIVWSHDGDYDKWRPHPFKGHSNYLSHVSWEPLHRAAACERFVSASKDMSLKVWKVGVGLLFNLSAHTACVTCVKWGGSGKIYSSSQDKTIIVWDADTGAARTTLRGHGHWVNFLALNTDLVLRTGSYDHEERTFPSKEDAKAYAQQRYDAVVKRSNGAERLASCSDDNTMFLWCPDQSDKPIARLTGHQGAVFHALFSPDGATLASCSADKSIRLWNALNGRFICTLRGHVAAVYHVSWSLDSRLLVSGSRDSTLKLWSATTKKLLEDLPGHSDEVFSTDWSPDGQRVASGSKDKKVKIWVH